mgnify:CR=1 FL=1
MMSGVKVVLLGRKTLVSGWKKDNEEKIKQREVEIAKMREDNIKYEKEMEDIDFLLRMGEAIGHNEGEKGEGK